MSRSATVRDLRRRNRAHVLRALLRSGESTRAALARECSLSAGTATNVVTDLIEEGLVEEIGQIPSDGGRPISRLSPRGDSAYFIGADVGEHGITAELFDLQLHRTDRVFVRVQRRSLGPNAIRDALAEAVSSLRDRNAVVDRRVVGVGLGLPGVVEQTPDGRTTVDTQSLGWQPIDLRELFPDTSLPVFAENGAKTMAMAEAWLGAAKSARHCIAALVGRGIGAGFLHDGSLLRGLTGSAGEWGHTKVAVRGRACRCGGAGCLEAYVGGTSIIERWAEAGAPTTVDEEGELARLLDLADRGDDTAARVVDETIEILGIGLANLVNLFNPEVIVLGGWVGLALAGARLDDLAQQVDANCLVRPASVVRLEISQLGGDAVALGAALLPLQELVEDRLAPSPA
ncbi:MAG: ROK family transcriptional regulator [Ilumatobacteraceae bacterium]|nr:ROK family transcriptional regulator [Ilumatobacteraceae bacterium]